MAMIEHRGQFADFALPPHHVAGAAAHPHRLDRSIASTYIGKKMTFGGIVRFSASIASLPKISCFSVF
jgi:hypothetical protein